VRAYQVLIYGGQPSPPAAHLVTADDSSVAERIADDLMAQSPHAVGVEVLCDGERCYARGVVPARPAPRARDSDGQP
jgi:hypothetical protein